MKFSGALRFFLHSNFTLWFDMHSRYVVDTLCVDTLCVDTLCVDTLCVDALCNALKLSTLAFRHTHVLRISVQVRFSYLKYEFRTSVSRFLLFKPVKSTKFVLREGEKYIFQKN